MIAFGIAVVIAIGMLLWTTRLHTIDIENGRAAASFDRADIARLSEQMLVAQGQIAKLTALEKNATSLFEIAGNRLHLLEDDVDQMARELYASDDNVGYLLNGFGTRVEAIENALRELGA